MINLIQFDTEEYKNLYNRFMPYYLFYKDEDNKVYCYGALIGKGEVTLMRTEPEYGAYKELNPKEVEYDIHPLVAQAMFKVKNKTND